MDVNGKVLEAESLEKQKFAARGLHFLAIQTGPEAEQPEGFWLLRDIEVAHLHFFHKMHTSSAPLQAQTVSKFSSTRFAYYPEVITFAVKLQVYLCQRV